MTFFEKELRKISSIYFLSDLVFIGKECYASFSPNYNKNLVCNIKLVKINTHMGYNAVKVSVINRLHGLVDSVTIVFAELWRENPINGRVTHSYIDEETAQKWTGHVPSEKDYDLLSEKIKDYLWLFSYGDAQ